MTTSGYPRIVKLWKRGTSLSEAKTIFEGDATDVSDGAYIIRDGNKEYLMVTKGNTFFTSKNFVMVDDKLIYIPIPDDSSMSGILNNQLIVNLKSDWNVDGVIYKQGSIISLNFTSLLNNKKDIQLIYQPDNFSSVTEVANTKNYLLLNILNNVKSELYSYANTNGKWVKTKVKAPEYGSINLVSTDELKDDYYFSFQNFLSPTTLYFSNAKTNTIDKVKSLASYFDASKYKVEQYKAKSKDGEMIPYFVVSSKKIIYNDTNLKNILKKINMIEVNQRVIL